MPLWPKSDLTNPGISQNWGDRGESDVLPERLADLLAEEIGERLARALEGAGHVDTGTLVASLREAPRAERSGHGARVVIRADPSREEWLQREHERGNDWLALDSVDLDDALASAVERWLDEAVNELGFS